MRIVHVTDCFLPMLGGIETQVSRLAEKQTQAGNQVTVLTCTADPKETTSNTPYQVVRSAWKEPLNAPIDPRAPRRFRELINRIQPDVVHLHMGELTPVVQSLLLSLAHTRQPLVVSVHSVWSECPTIPLYRQIAKTSRLTDEGIAWTGVSELVASRIRQTIPNQSVRVLPNGIDSAAWKLPEMEESTTGGSGGGSTDSGVSSSTSESANTGRFANTGALSAATGAPATEPLHVVCATRFAPRKRIPQLLKILREARQIAQAQRADVPPLRATIAGEGPLLSQTRQQAPAWLNLPGRLTQPELVHLYAKADVFIAPGIKDAFSIAGVEARAAGLALLTRSQSGLGQGLRDGIEGRCAHTDIEMAQILAEWILHPERVREIKTHNRTAKPHFDWSEVLPQTEAIYRWASELRKAQP